MHRMNGRKPGVPAAGFSVIELMVSLVIMGIMIAVSIPSYRLLTGSTAIKGGAQHLAGNFRLARQMAVSQGVPYIVAWSDTSRQVRIVRDQNGDGDPDAGEATQGPFTLPRGVSLSNPISGGFATSYVSLRVNGTASASGSLILSDARQDTIRVVLLGPTGQVRID
jgi:prepilin-type N-terminal cleavage/methylation domain-containing protein